MSARVPRTPVAEVDEALACTLGLFFLHGSQLGELYQEAASALTDDYGDPEDALLNLDATCQRMRAHIWRIRQARRAKRDGVA